ncbi:Glucan endo-1,3-alpha-glucosidase agn1 [Colletotrichum tanaceti]|uniref:Glucan endo-1,3-alpha-glucosidase agn1 n=1 Tax=Colletotrichum tanaceti TaxID=1306861 RepID=A0A4U6XIU3_9PEZI|nr:Glucan endo-1,3-alpha-glucosidase agn1 [Colletotrichum tanaceti]
MRLITLLTGLLAAVTQVRAAAVVAHFMLINTKNYTMSDYEDDFKLAKDAHIDAFALNMGLTDPNTAESLEDAFTAAKTVGFQLFFSFDYNGGYFGGKPWPKETILEMGDKYFKRDEYFKYADKPVASTFEGTENAKDWIEIKEKTGAFFIPDWSSISPEAALALADGVADGLFSWNAWPIGDQDMTSKGDAAYQWALKGKPYMMPVSPWFYTNLPGYNKNWVWRGDDLWYDRWVQVMEIMPTFVQIISWNDYGESHHIGPIRSNALEAFEVGKAPFNYALNHPHDGWRHTLPHLIESYKNAVQPDIKTESLTTWYRSSPALACKDGGTTANTEAHAQKVLPPAEVVRDEIFYSALLTSAAEVTVSVGGKAQKGAWTSTPDGGEGVYHGSVPFLGVGEVVVTMTKYGTEIARIKGVDITRECPGGMTNWNAWVAAVDALHVDDPNPTPTQTGDGPKSTANGGGGGDDGSAASSLSRGGLVYVAVVLVSMAIAGVV